MQDLPNRLFRVCYAAARGWPDPEDRTDTSRTFTNAKDAARQVAAIEGMPSHLQLHGVFVTECNWQPVPLDALPALPPMKPTEEEI